MSHPATLLTAPEVAGMLRITVRTLQRLDADGALVPIRVGRAVRYRPEDVAAYIERAKATA
jgi:excisionase family DNA binding protein